MIEKQITFDGKTYTVGFKEVGSERSSLECHILEKRMFFKKSIYIKLFIKGLDPNYKQLAVSTIFSYQKECEQKERLISEQW